MLWGSTWRETVGAFVLMVAAVDRSCTRVWWWEAPRAGSTVLPTGAPAPGAHYLLGCRYWWVNMLSSLSNQPALFLSSLALL